MSDTAPFKSVAQVAEMLGASQDVVRTFIARGELRASDIATSAGKKRWRIALADLEQFLAARRNVPPPKTTRRRRRENTPVYY